MKFLFFIISVIITELYSVNSTNLKIIGGTPAYIKDFPYQASVIVDELPTCSGTIISENYVITAAHCIDGSTADEIIVQVGTDQINAPDALKIKVNKINEHPKYSIWNYDYDFAILSLDTNLTYSPTINKVELPNSKNIPKAGTKAIVAGWGKTKSKNGKSSTQLMQTNVPILSKEDCMKDYTNQVTDRMLCAGAKRHDACFGDSGSGLVVNGVVIGVVSWGYGCGEAKHPGVYTSVIALRDYIQNVTGI